jgi:adenosylmethionine-8-amino-7-oxononanoate aminotransferase
MSQATPRSNEPLIHHWMPFTPNRQFLEAPRMIARAEGGRTICDLRAVAPEDDRLLETALACAWAPAR